MTTADPGRASEVRRRLLHGLLIVVVSGLVFSNTLSNPFHYDDHYRIVDNPGIQKLSPLWRHFVDPRTMSREQQITQYRPLLPLTLSINHALGGESLPGYHLANLLFQVVASLLVYFLCLELLGYRAGAGEIPARPERPALFTALIFAVHPVSGFLVNYVSARDLILMQLFLVASLLVYVRMRRLGASATRWAATLCLLALSLLSKTNAAVAPLIVLLFELVVARESPFRARTWLRPVPFAVVVAAYFMYTRLFLGFSDLAQALRGEAPRLEYPLVQLKLHLSHYLRNFVWPFYIRQCPAVSKPQSLFEPAVLAGAAFIVVSLVAAWRLRKSQPLLSFCIATYWILLAPTSSVLPLFQLAVDYRPYASSPFLFLFVVLLGYRVLPGRVAATVGLLSVLGFSAASVSLNTTWRSAESLWSHSVRHGGDEIAHMNLALSIADRSDPRVRALLEESLRIAPNYVLAHINLGLLLIDLGEPERGLEHCLRAVALRPDWPMAHYWLSRAYREIDRPAEAFQAARRAAALDPRNLTYQYWAARNALWTGQHEESLRLARAVRAIREDHEEIRFIEAFALQKLGRRIEAIEGYRRYLAVHPDDAQAQFNLGYALMQDGDCRSALEHFRITLDLRPEYAEAMSYIGECRETLRSSE